MHAKLQINTKHFDIQIKISVCLQQVPKLVTNLKCIWKKYSKNQIYFDPWSDCPKVTKYQTFSTFFSVIFSVYLDYNRIWQFDSSVMLQDTKNEVPQNILLL